MKTDKSKKDRIEEKKEKEEIKVEKGEEINDVKDESDIADSKSKGERNKDIANVPDDSSAVRARESTAGGVEPGVSRNDEKQRIVIEDDTKDAEDRSSDKSSNLELIIDSILENMKLVIGGIVDRHVS